VTEIALCCDGARGHFIQADRSPAGSVELRWKAAPLASWAVRSMAQAVRELTQSFGLSVYDLQGVVAHGGNGRMPALLARQLGLPPERVWSAVSQTGKLGSASLPVAWASHSGNPKGPVVWTSVGAGLTCAAALTGIFPS
jgi:3-oxoacyl-[acyl-carrier-protein] synthase III